MKKNKKNKSKVEFSLNAHELLELLNFLEYVKQEKEAWCGSAAKVHAQLQELIVARIEGRKPRVVLDGTTVLAIDQQKLQKLAGVAPFDKTNSDLDKLNSVVEKFNLATPEEIVRPDQHVHNVPLEGENPNVKPIGSLVFQDDDWKKNPDGTMSLRPSRAENR